MIAAVVVRPARAWLGAVKIVQSWAQDPKRTFVSGQARYSSNSGVKFSASADVGVADNEDNRLCGVT